MNELDEFRCWWPWKGEGGAKADVGVNTAGFWVDGVPVAEGMWLLRLGTSPL